MPATFLFMMTQVPIESVALKLFTGIEKFEIMAIPFFILAGNFLTHGGVARRMINFASSLVGHWAGGLGLAGVMACALFAAVSGSSPATVVAIEPCELLAVTKRDFNNCLAKNFEMAMAVMRGLVRRLREADRKIGSLALLDVYGRVARLLLDMSENVNGQKVVTRRLPKQDIAKMIGASREMVSRVMKDLQTSGHIEVKSGAIFLHEAMLMSEARA